MEISGFEMDFGDIMSRAQSSVLEEFDVSPWRYDSENRLGQLNLVIRAHVWHEMVECLKRSAGNGHGTVSAEEAMAEVMRRGLQRENIRFRKNAFIARLANTKFKVRKRDIGYAAGPETVGGYGSEEMGWCSPSMFTDLMLAFDALTPQIDSEAAPVLEMLHEAKKAIIREQMAERVQRTAIKSLADRYLTPLGITCTTNVDGDRVSLHLELLKRCTIEASLAELPALLEDTAAILESMQPVMENDLFFFR